MSIPIPTRFALAAALICFWGAPRPSEAQVPLLPEEIQRVDVIALERDGREIFGFDALTGSTFRMRLELGEEVLFQQARGRVGLLVTDRRALAVAPGIDFRELRFQLREDPPERGLVEDQIAILVTPRRAIAFLGNRGVWIEEKLAASERVVALRVGAGAGVVATHRRALGVGAGTSRFVAADIQVGETLEGLSAQDVQVTLRTNRRILVFNAPRALWTDEDRRLR